jgi:hypothetical protein
MGAYMNDPVSECLERFQEKDVTVKVCRLLFGTIPTAPTFAFYRDLKGAIRRVGHDQTGEVPASMLEAVQSQPVIRALWVADKLDIEDATLASYTGASNLLSWFTDGRSERRAFEADRPQAIDAVLKTLGVSYMTNKLFEGSVKEKISRLISLPAGREIVLYLCVAEIALPFFADVVEGGWDFASKHLQGAMTDGESKFGQVMGEKATGDLKETLDGMNGLLEKTMSEVREHLGPLVSKLDSAMPKVFNFTGSATGVMATALDALPVWRFLGGRLAAEASAVRMVDAATPETAANSTPEISS